MIDPGSFFGGLAVGVVAGMAALTGIGWMRIRRRGPTADRARAAKWDAVRELVSQSKRLEREHACTVAHVACRRLELAKLNQEIRRRNRKIANLRIGGGSKREGTPANDVAGPRAVSSPKVGADRSRPLLLSGQSMDSTTARGRTPSG